MRNSKQNYVFISKIISCIEAIGRLAFAYGYNSAGLIIINNAHFFGRTLIIIQHKIYIYHASFDHQIAGF